MPSEASQTYEFDSFRLDEGRAKLLLDGQVVPLSPKAFELLLLLVRRRGEVLSKEQLLDQLWPSTNVTEANLTQTIYLLRKALGEASGPHHFIETVPRLGYRFLAEVRETRGHLNAQPEDRVVPQTEVEDSHEIMYEADVHTEGALKSRADSFRRRGARRLRSLYDSRWFPALSVLLFVAGSILIICRAQPARVAEAESKNIQSLAVLPFKNIDSGAADMHLGLGMTDIIITKLGRIKLATVRPTSSVFKYTEGDYDSTAAGKELKVDAVLDGTVQLVENRVRLSLRLIAVADGRTLWAGVFDEPMRNVFNIQDSIAERVAQALGQNLNAGERAQMAKRSTQNVEAYQSYMRGLYFWYKRSPEGLEKSVNYFADATGKDPGYSLAYAGLADACALLALNAPDPARENELFEKARGMAVKAKQLDDSLPEAYAAHFLVKYYHDEDIEGGERELLRAIELNGSFATAYIRYGFLLRDRGDLPQAQAMLQEALKSEPSSWIGNMALCEVLWFRGDYSASLKYCGNAAEIEPHRFEPPLHIAWIYTEQHKYVEAIELLTALLRQGVDDPGVPGALGYAYARAGRRANARQELLKLSQASGKPYRHASMAIIYSGLGEYELAFRHLMFEDKKDLRIRVSLRFDPRLTPLRSEPRFQPLFEHL
jgi:DNA-binding winged helix-turn-helix (wHTH) protein/TolB-like protein/Tfp pilus assembly protein PilF